MSKVEEKKESKKEQIYEVMLSMADPNTGRVAVSGAQVGKLIGISAGSARLYVNELVKEGTLVQISETKSGIPTLYRIPSLCKGDVLTHYEIENKTLPPYEPEREKELLYEQELKNIDTTKPIVSDEVSEEFTLRDEDVLRWIRTEARWTLESQEELIGKLMTGYLQLYRSLEKIAKRDFK